MIKSADKDGSGYVSCGEFSDLLKQDLFDVAGGLDVDLGQGQAQKKGRKSSTHRSMIGTRKNIQKSTYGKKRTIRR